MASEARQLSAAIEAPQAQRGLLGDAVVDAALGVVALPPSAL